MGLFNKGNTTGTGSQDVPDLKTELTVLSRMDAARRHAEQSGDEHELRNINAVAQTAEIRARDARAAGQR